MGSERSQSIRTDDQQAKIQRIKIKLGQLRQVIGDRPNEVDINQGIIFTADVLHIFRYSRIQKLNFKEWKDIAIDMLEQIVEQNVWLQYAKPILEFLRIVDSNRNKNTCITQCQHVITKAFQIICQQNQYVFLTNFHQIEGVLLDQEKSIGKSSDISTIKEVDWQKFLEKYKGKTNLIDFIRNQENDVRIKLDSNENLVHLNSLQLKTQCQQKKKQQEDEINGLYQNLQYKYQHHEIFNYLEQEIKHDPLQDGDGSIISDIVVNYLKIFDQKLQILKSNIDRITFEKIIDIDFQIMFQFCLLLMQRYYSQFIQQFTNIDEDKRIVMINQSIFKCLFNHGNILYQSVEYLIIPLNKEKFEKYLIGREKMRQFKFSSYPLDKPKFLHKINDPFNQFHLYFCQVINETCAFQKYQEIVNINDHIDLMIAKHYQELEPTIQEEQSSITNEIIYETSQRQPIQQRPVRTFEMTPQDLLMIYLFIIVNFSPNEFFFLVEFMEQFFLNIVEPKSEESTYTFQKIYHIQDWVAQLTNEQITLFQNESNVNI